MRVLRRRRGPSLVPCILHRKLTEPQNRRSYYSLSPESTLPDDQLTALIRRAVKHAPSSFMMQESRVIVVSGEKHREVWEMVKETYKATLGGDGEFRPRSLLDNRSTRD